jgi:metal-sulfur cluster biosynthetic enzyme
MQEEILKEHIVQALYGVIDPEMHIDIYTLGLIYDITLAKNKVLILMTLTTPLCPYAEDIVSAVKAACEALGVCTEVQITFSPPWVSPPHLRAILGV